MKLFDRSTKAGFTLVELIVVIAILAILAGIAIPVYSGYIKKANKAADLVLLDALNTAFAAACLENGFNAKDVSTATLTIENKCITGVSVPTIPASFLSAGANGSGIVYGNLSAGNAAQPVQLAATSDSVNASFVRYFAGNTTVQLKYYESASDFTFRSGCFVAKDDAKSDLTLVGEPQHDAAAGTTTYNFVNSQGDEISFTVDDDKVAMFEASTFGTNMEASDLTSEVGSLVNAMNNVMGSGGTQLANIMANSGFDFTTLGMDIYEKDEDGNYVTDESGKKVVDSSKLSNYSGSDYANAVVMMVAKNTSAEGINSMFSSMMDPNSSGVSLGSSIPDMLSNAAALYGVAMAYSNSDAAKGQTIDGKSASQYMDYVSQQISSAAKTGNVNDVLGKIGLLENLVYTNVTDPETGEESRVMTEQFTNYIKPVGDAKSQMQTDVAGYVAAMQTISANDSALADSGAITYGYDDPTITAIMNTILG